MEKFALLPELVWKSLVNPGVKPMLLRVYTTLRMKAGCSVHEAAQLIGTTDARVREAEAELTRMGFFERVDGKPVFPGSGREDDASAAVGG
jgi:hypothetical protein